MKIPALLVSTVLLVLCHFDNTVTHGGDPTLSESQVKVEQFNPDLTESSEFLNAGFKRAEACYKNPEECFRTTRGLPENYTPFDVKFLDPHTSKTYSFISIPDLEGKDHVYAVQVTPELGRGATGEVYLAKDIKIPDEFVAIKVTKYQTELKGLKLAGELLGSSKKAGSLPESLPTLFLVMPFVPGIRLGELANKPYNGRPAYQYWMDKDNEGYRTLLKRIAQDIVAPLVNKGLIHMDLQEDNLMVAQIDENYLPTKMDPATGLQYFRAIDFGRHHEILDEENILHHIHNAASWAVERVFAIIYKPSQHRKNDYIAIETFKKDVVEALNKNKFEIKVDGTGMLIGVARKRRELLPSP